MDLSVFGHNVVDDLLALKDRALDETSEGITIADVSQPDIPIIYVNHGFERLTGYMAQEVVGQNCRFLQTEETEPQTLEVIRRAITEKKECTVELLNRRKDGTPFWNRLSITPVKNDHGQVTHFIGVQSDITKRVQAENELRQAQTKLEETSRRMRNSLKAAAKIQRAMLPQSLPEVPGVRFAWEFRPCEILAGDIFNIFKLDERHVGIYILDVSGHGVPAALMSVTLSRSLTPHFRRSSLFDRLPDNTFRNSKPSRVAERLNQQFPMDYQTGQFFTLMYGILDTHINEFRYVSAGHSPMIHVPAEGSAVMAEARGFPVGIHPEPNYQNHSIQLNQGDRLYFYSDGIVEHPDEQGRLFGQENLTAVLESARSVSLETSLESVLTAVARWHDDAPLNDDLTIAAIEIE